MDIIKSFLVGLLVLAGCVGAVWLILLYSNIALIVFISVIIIIAAIAIGDSILHPSDDDEDINWYE